MVASCTRRVYGSRRVTSLRLPLDRILCAMLSVVVFSHVALTPITSFRSSATRTFVAKSTDGAAHDAALKHPDGLALAAAMHAISRCRVPHAEVRVPENDQRTATRSTAWRHGASFARAYVPLRLRRLFAPPSTGDPDA